MAKTGVKTSDLAKKSGLTPQGVNLKRRRGQTDEEIEKGEGAKVGGESLAAAQTRKEIALADTRELERDIRLGELIPLATAQKGWALLVQLVRTEMLAMPNSLASQLAAYTDPVEIRVLLTKDIDARLNSLAEEFQSTASRAMGNGGEVDPASGAPDGDAMGGVEPDTEQ